MKKILICLLLGIFSLNAKCLRDDSVGIVFCKDTKLEWIDNDKVIQIRWDKGKNQAISYCNDLVYNSHKDWRLPNINELLSIVDYSKWEMAIEGSFKTLPLESRFYSSTFDSNTDVFYVEFSNGTSGKKDIASKCTKLSVRCVRDR